MKFSSIVAIFLMLVLTSSQVIAAACSVSCAMASQEQMQFGAVLNSSTGDHCQHEPTNKAKQTHKGNTCTMAGCHLAQSIAFASESSKATFYALDMKYPRFTSISISADIPPPIKPPA